MTADEAAHLPVVVLEGSARERGAQHGAAFRARIQDRIANLDAKLGASLPGALARSRRVFADLEGAAPSVFDEVRGIAHGAGADVGKVTLLSAFEMTGEAAAGCTSVGLAGRGGAVIGQNWDALPDAAQDIVVFAHRVANRVILLTVASIGSVGWVGANEHGLGLVNTDLVLRGHAESLPSQFVRRIVLEKHTRADAVAFLSAIPHAGGRSYLLGDADGGVSCIEVGPGPLVRSLKPSGLVVHTNHALHPDLAAIEDEIGLQRTYPTSPRRLEAARRRAQGAAAGMRQLTAILSDRDGAPDSVWKSASEREPTQTVFTFAFDCAKRLAYFGREPSSALDKMQLGVLG